MAKVQTNYLVRWSGQAASGTAAAFLQVLQRETLAGKRQRVPELTDIMVV